MNHIWGADRPTDDEPGPVHALGCAVWTTHDEPCDCGSHQFQVEVQARLELFEGYRGRAT